MTVRVSGSKLSVIALLVLLVISTAPFSVSSLDFSEEYNVTDTSDPEGAPRLDIDSEGNFHLLYLMNDGGDFDKVMYRKVGPTGSTLTGPLQISSSSVDGPFGQLAIAVDSSDRSHIAFSVKTTSDDARDVYYAQVDSGGSLKVSAKNVHTSDVQASALDIEADGSGNAYIVWNERTDPPTIEWMKVSSTGSVVRTARTISGDLGSGGDVSFPRLGVTSSGDTLIAWQQKSNVLVRTSIFFTALDPQGGVDVDPVEVQSNAAIDLSFLEATGDDSGDLHITYIQNNAIEYARIDRDGMVEATFEVAIARLGEVFGPDISVSPGGDIYVVYGLRENLLSGEYHEYVRVRWDSNNTWSGQDQVDDGAAIVTMGVVAADDNGAGIVFIRDSDLWLVTVQAESPNNPPVASLSFSPTDPGVDETVTFDGSDSSDPDDADYVDEYFFEYGDGGDSGWTTSSSVIHSYSSAGTYTARLRVRDSHGRESETSATGTVRVTSSPSNRAPTAVLTANPTTVDLGKTVTFNGDSSSDPDGIVSLYNFDFGDGVSTGWVTSSIQTHSYSSEGLFTTTLQVQDDDGANSENTASIRITVEDTNEIPTATIESIDPSPALQGDDVTLVGNGEDSDGTITAYSWESNFDGEIGTTETIVVNTLTVATHTISFKVRDDDNAWSEVATDTLVIKANSPPTLEDRTELKNKVFTDTLIEFRVVYTDADGDRPTAARIFFGKGGDYQDERLAEVDTNDKDYTDGKEYFFNKKLDKPGTWRYYFEFENLKNPKRKTLSKDVKVQEPEAPGFAMMPAAGALVAVALAVSIASRRKGTNG
jgi:PKD repeat protein